MIELLAVLGATGIALMATGLPLFHRPRVRGRVDPYVGGLHGRPSGLLTRRTGGGRVGSWLDERFRSLGMGRNAHLEARLAAAGDERGVGAYRMEQVVWAAGACVTAWAALLFVSVLGVPTDLRTAPALGLVAATTGFLARDWWLGRTAQTRRAALEEDLPASIDLLTLSIMSGESVPSAFERVAQLLSGCAVGEELAAVTADVRAGATFTEALEGLKERIPGFITARFVDALITGIEKGSPLADVLRAQADDARAARRRHLLELGGRREVLMLVPVVFLIMPVVVVFALYPGLVSLDLLVP